MTKDSGLNQRNELREKRRSHDPPPLHKITMSKASEVRYRAWDKKINKMRTVLTISFDKKYVTCKDKPNEQVSFSETIRFWGGGVHSYKTLWTTEETMKFVPHNRRSFAPSRRSGLLPNTSYNINQFLHEWFENAMSLSSWAIEWRVYVDSSFLVSLVRSVSHEKIIAEKSGEKN